jgi:hypothetical protein
MTTLIEPGHTRGLRRTFHGGSCRSERDHSEGELSPFQSSVDCTTTTGAQHEAEIPCASWDGVFGYHSSCWPCSHMCSSSSTLIREGTSFGCWAHGGGEADNRMGPLRRPPQEWRLQMGRGLGWGSFALRCSGGHLSASCLSNLLAWGMRQLSMTIVLEKNDKRHVQYLGCHPKL